MGIKRTGRLIKLSRKLLGSVILAGFIVMFVGLYYIIGKAGIPYQDPPLQLLIEYNVLVEVGYTLMAVGFSLSILGTFAMVILRAVEKHRKNKG